jgi:acyl-coenzyme A synthetase/AMP-(fatty) acid ligase
LSIKIVDFYPLPKKQGGKARGKNIRIIFDIFSLPIVDFYWQCENTEGIFTKQST